VTANLINTDKGGHVIGIVPERAIRVIRALNTVCHRAAPAPRRM
jgi:hypothetical protein